MSAPGKVVRSELGRRRVQTLVIGLATMMEVAVSALGGSLLAVSGAPFDDAFARQHGEAARQIPLSWALDEATQSGASSAPPGSAGWGVPGASRSPRPT